MKNLLLSILLLGLSSITCGQLNSLQGKWSEPTKSKKNIWNHYSLSQTSSSHVIFQTIRKLSSRTLQVSVLDNSGNLKLVKLVKEAKARGFRYKDFIELDGNLYLITTEKNQTSKIISLFAEQINRKSFEIMGEKIELSKCLSDRSIFTEKGFNHESLGDSKTTYFFYAKNSLGQLAVANINQDINKQALVNISTWSPSLTKLTTKSMTWAYNYPFTLFKNFVFGTNNNFYLSAEVYSEKVYSYMSSDFEKHKSQGKLDPIIQIITIDEDKGASFHNLLVEEAKINEYTLELNKNGELLVTGLYSKNKLQTIKGSFFQKFNDIALSEKGQHQFSDSLITLSWDLKHMRKAEKKQKNKGETFEMMSFKLRQTIAKSGQEKIYIYENRTKSTSGSGGTTVTHSPTDASGSHMSNTTGGVSSTSFHANDLLVICREENGKTKWTQRIPKKSHYSVKNYTTPYSTTEENNYNYSFLAGQIKDKFIIIFNDSRENISPYELGEIEAYKPKSSHAICSMVEIDMDGNATRNELVQNNDYSMAYKLSSIKENKISLFFVGKKSSCIYHLE